MKLDSTLTGGWGLRRLGLGPWGDWAWGPGATWAWVRLGYSRFKNQFMILNHSLIHYTIWL